MRIFRRKLSRPDGQTLPKTRQRGDGDLGNEVIHCFLLYTDVVMRKLQGCRGAL